MLFTPFKKKIIFNIAINTIEVKRGRKVEKNMRILHLKKGIIFLLALSLLSSLNADIVKPVKAAALPDVFDPVTWDQYSNLYLGGNKHTVLSENGDLIKSENVSGNALNWGDAKIAAENYARDTFNLSELELASSSMPSLASLNPAIANGYLSDKVAKQDTWWLSDDSSTSLQTRRVVDSHNNAESYYIKDYEDVNGFDCIGKNLILNGARPIENKVLGGGSTTGESMPNGKPKLTLSNWYMSGWHENSAPIYTLRYGYATGDKYTSTATNNVILSARKNAGGYGNLFSDDKCTNAIGTLKQDMELNSVIAQVNGESVYIGQPIRQGDCIALDIDRAKFNTNDPENYFLDDKPGAFIGVYAKVNLKYSYAPAHIAFGLYGENGKPHLRVQRIPGKTCKATEIKAENNAARPLVKADTSKIAYVTESSRTAAGSWPTSTTIGQNMPVSHLLPEKSYVPTLKDNTNLTLDETLLPNGMSYDKGTNILFVDTGDDALASQIYLPIQGSGATQGIGYISASATDSYGNDVFAKLGKTTQNGVVLNLSNLTKTGMLEDKEILRVNVYREDMTEGDATNYVSNALSLIIVGKTEIKVNIPKVKGPRDVTVTEGEQPTLSVTATFDNIPGFNQKIRYQWYGSDEYGNFNPIAGAQTNTLTLPPATLADDEKQYYCKVSNIAGIVNSRVASLYVNPR